MSQLGELLNDLAIQSGIDVNNEGLKALLSNATISAYDIPDAIASSIQSNLLTVDSAKNNPIIKSHFFALALNGVDSEINGLMNELQFSDEVKAEILAEKSSTKRSSLLTKKAIEIEAAKGNAGNVDVEKFNAKISELNNQLVAKDAERLSYGEEITSKHRNETKDLLMKNQLSNYNYAMNTIPKEVNIATALAMINQEANTKGIKVALNDNNQLDLMTADGTKYFENNKEVNVQSFIDGVLGQHKLIVAKPSNETPPANVPTPTPANTPGQPNASAFTQRAAELAKQYEE